MTSQLTGPTSRAAPRPAHMVKRGQNVAQKRSQTPQNASAARPPGDDPQPCGGMSAGGSASQSVRVPGFLTQEVKNESRSAS